MGWVFGYIQPCRPMLTHQVQRLRQLVEEFRTEFRIQMKEGHACELVGAVFPGVVCAALNDDVAFLQGDLSVLEDQNHLSLDHDSIIKGLRSVHHRAFAAELWRIDVDDAEKMA